MVGEFTFDSLEAKTRNLVGKPAGASELASDDQELASPVTAQPSHSSSAFVGFPPPPSMPVGLDADGQPFAYEFTRSDDE